jgi:hypothetical protein
MRKMHETANDVDGGGSVQDECTHWDKVRLMA